MLSDNLAASDRVVTFDAVYQLSSSGFVLAEMKRSIKQLPSGEYLYRSDTRTIGIVAMFYKHKIVEESRWKLEQGQLYPLKYTYDRTRDKKSKHVDIDFDWANKIIFNRVNDNLWKMPLEDGTLDKLLYQYAVMRDLPDKEYLTYTVADGGKMKTYHLQRIGKEVVNTPLGKVETIKVRNIKSKDDRLLMIWCAPKYKYLPVKVEHTEDGTVTTAILQKLKGL